MSGLDWNRDGADWPNRSSSRFVSAGGLRWHIQEMGSGPSLLLVHGTGASTHSWRSFGPVLAKRFRVLAMDLPGHGFTEAPRSSQITLPFMAKSVEALLKVLKFKPDLAVGHSAGVAILCRMALDHSLDGAAIISLNGALLPFGGFASQLFPAMARVLFLNPFVPGFFSWRANDINTVRRLITGTGSEIDAEGLALYQRLFSKSTHVASALGMMANWDLASLARELPQLKTKLTLFAATNDTAIPPDVAFKVQNLVRGSHIALLRGAGHLAHEEKPEDVADKIFVEAERCGFLPQEVASESAT